MQSPRSRKSLTWRLALDVGMFVAMLILADPRGVGGRQYGLSVHEWLGLAIAPVLVYHLTLNWAWIVGTTRRILARLPTETRTNQVLNFLLFATMSVSVWSGVEVSEVALPAVGLPVFPSFAWRELHEVSSNLSLALIGAHVALHWKWIARALRPFLTLAPKSTRTAVATGAR